MVLKYTNQMKAASVAIVLYIVPSTHEFTESCLDCFLVPPTYCNQLLIPFHFAREFFSRDNHVREHPCYTREKLILSMSPLITLMHQNSKDCKRLSRQKINDRKNQKNCGNSETTIGKLLARRIQICFDYFCKIYFLISFFKISFQIFSREK